MDTYLVNQNRVYGFLLRAGEAGVVLEDFVVVGVYIYCCKLTLFYGD